jgi:hypothetical protein
VITPFLEFSNGKETSMSSADRFPVRLTDIDACPERFRGPLKNVIDRSETIDTLVYCPPYPAARTPLPSSVLCVTDRQWLIAHDAGRNRVVAKQAHYADTLFVELAIVLLYGRLKIDFAKEDRAGSAECYFNTVMEPLFCGVLETVLNRIDGLKPAPKGNDPEILEQFRGWSFKFQNYGQDYLLPGSRLSASLYWPTVFGFLRRELAAAGAILITDRHLVIIAEEKSRFWFRPRDETKYGATISYLPCGRISGFQIYERRRINILEMAVHSGHGGEPFQVQIPIEETERITSLLGRFGRTSSQHHEMAIG